VARALAAAGAAVAVADMSAERAGASRDAIEQDGGKAVDVPFDVTDVAAVRAGIESVEAQLGTVDILVNNAGLPDPEPGQTAGYLGPFKDSDPAVWHRWIDINLYGAMYCIRTVLPGMVDRGFGRIIQISSTAGSRGTPTGGSVYGASKAGIEGLLRHVAHEVAPHGVTANSLALGPLEGAGRVENDKTRLTLSMIPVGRRGRPAEVGAAAVWLASDEAAWVTGQTIHLNGGSFSGR
jgi:NAD(P)-dependent dehydrogenase (short-subunit alcohol dehydrogenase family)